MADPVNEKKSISIPANIAGLNFSVEQLPNQDTPSTVNDTPSVKSEATKVEGAEGPKNGEPVNKSTDTTTDDTSTSKTNEVSHSTKPSKLTIKEAREAISEGKGDVSTDSKGSKEVITEQKSFLKPPKGKEDKVEDKVEDKTKDGQIAVPRKDQKGTTDTFDYSKYSPTEQEYLKNMSRLAREHVVKLITENKELAKLKNDNYLQHPNAYILDPQFNEIHTQLSRAQGEQEHWKNQLLLAKQGKKVRDLIGWDSKTRQPIYGNELEPTDAIEEQLRMNVGQCAQVAQKLNGDLVQFPNRYKQQIGNDLALINQERAKRFEWVTKPELMEYSIDYNGKDTPLKDIKKGLISIWPQYMQSHLAVETWADTMIAMVIQRAELDSLKSTATVAKVKKEEEEHFEPSSKVKPAKTNDTVRGDVREFSMAGIPTDLTGLQ